MGIFTKDIHTLEDLFTHQLKDIYYAEHRITKALPKMIAKATSPALKQGFETHLAETETQIQRLDRVFSMLGLKAESVTCKAIDGIIAEAEEVAGEVDDKAVLDAGLLAAAQAVEHYEIARYGTLVAWGKRLGHGDAVALFEQSLAEEKATDKKLTDIAAGEVNRKAA
ncbi:ferritin-like domain-containing protein [Lichenibacterium ramalinae]|uniref:Ferritin-like domain-containing protein n=1 Tax=Lichenibacterium ramalinae TaxID=2316527 RepID=A0A4Q2RF38_9HYPH|nr:ferritin-like domain-containing protein [Lichenibacterium ramalinae]RYB05771.1 ferritin-like domain-containing protein [Lichenibacterium ramalinae]